MTETGLGGATNWPRRLWYPQFSPLEDATTDTLEYAHEKCSETVRKVMFALLGFSLFSLLTALGTPDVALINAAGSTIKIPFADVPITFSAFLVVAPLLLIVLLIYLHIFIGYLIRLEIGLDNDSKKIPALFTLDEPVPNLLAGFIFYWLVPLVLLVTTWKALARLEWGIPIALVTLMVTAALAWVRIRRCRSRRRILLNLMPWGVFLASVLSAGTIAYGLTFSTAILDPLHRRLDLFRADLQGLWLVEVDLRQADLRFANLEGASLLGADLSHANLGGANLKSADLRNTKLIQAVLERADLTDADLLSAELTGANLKWAQLTRCMLARVNADSADLSWAVLTDAHMQGASLWNTDLIGADLKNAFLTDAELSGADLSGAKNLTQSQLTFACADEHGGGAAPTGRQTRFPDNLWPGQSCFAKYYD